MNFFADCDDSSDCYDLMDIIQMEQAVVLQELGVRVKWPSPSKHSKVHVKMGRNC